MHISDHLPAGPLGIVFPSVFGVLYCSDNPNSTGLAVRPAPLLELAEELRKDGQTAMLVAVDGNVAGLVGVSDPIKESTPDAIRELRAAGLKIIMVTGDNKTHRQGSSGQALHAVGIPLTAGALSPSFGLLVNPMISAAAMSLSSVSVIWNALRLRTE
jgi:cation transport ATPase